MTKAKKIAIQVFIIVAAVGYMIISLFSSCGPSAVEKEKAKREAQAEAALYKIDTASGIACLSIDQENTSVEEGPVIQIMQNRIKKALLQFKTKHPRYKITSIYIQDQNNNDHLYEINGIWITFEPISPPPKSALEQNLIAGTVVIPKGGSLCGTLGMTEKEALTFSKTNHLPFTYKGKLLFSKVDSGDLFHFHIGKIWEKR